MAHAIALIHEQNGVFGISFPDFRGCISTADSLDEAIARGSMALALHVEGMVEDAEPLPVLRTATEIRHSPDCAEDIKDAVMAAVPVDLPGKSVRINITMDKHSLNAVDRAAKAIGSSHSGYLAEAARTRLGG